MDFFTIATRSPKRGEIHIYPKFIVKSPSQDLMVRGGDFYAVWMEDKGLWSTSEQDVIDIVDRELDKFAKENADKFMGDYVKVLHMWDAESGMIDAWHKYCQRQMRDCFHMLDEKLIFSNSPTNKKDYASKKLPYPLEEGPIDAYDKLMSVLYSDEERHKIEWAIGSIVSGDSKKLQKFLVLYGAAGTGKSTVLNIIQSLFNGYYSVFDARALGSASNAFALEAFKSNPLVAIQHDGDLSHIEDNTRLNSLVSHETMTVNSKFEKLYSTSFKSFLFMGTNKPVRITDAKSGLIRRLIDVSPSGKKIPVSEYKTLVKQIDFELGHIAKHCLDIYEENPGAYDDYIPISMLGASNDFFNFVADSYPVFKKEDGTTLKAAWEMYKTYCDEAKVTYPMSKMRFKEELKNYFREYSERYLSDDGSRPRNYYSGFKSEKFDDQFKVISKGEDKILLQLDSSESIFDKLYSDYPAQYANSNGNPKEKWDEVNTKLSDLNTSKLHYVRLPENHIVIDFDIQDEDGNKLLERNLEEAAKWPATYAELSKSGCGVHLHYIYTGDPNELSRVYDKNIEVKVFNGNSSLRRRLTKCNGLPIASISSGLPMKGAKVVNFETVQSEKGLRNLIIRNLKKEIHPGTKPSIDFIFKILEDAYNSGLKYDVSDMRQGIIVFAAGSTHQAEYCLKLVDKMKFKSDDISDSVANDDADLVFYDVEVFPNLFLINHKKDGEGKPVVRMINPTPQEVEKLMEFRLVGFNCRRYDNHILYARLMGYTNDQLYKLSQRIISGKSSDCFFSEAYNVSYTDVYDFAAKKQSLKKWEIELGIHHQELGLKWDEPVPEELWEKVAEYCDNDVLATEAVFHHLKGDFTARQILADLAGMTVNDTTNSLTTRIIFGGERHPQSSFNYRNLGEMPKDGKGLYSAEYTKDGFKLTNYKPGSFNVLNDKQMPIFPGYIFDNGVSTYRGEETGEGGYVYAEPGIYYLIALLDIASMHPSSVVDEQLFGEYTARFEDILNARIAIKHKDFEKARKMLNGALAKYLNDEATADDLAQALKIAINSVYGLTSAKFENAFRDPRNIDNIVAKRGALFMINLKHEVQERGYKVAHIKTDSIKIPDADNDIIKFVMDYGKLYGYNFEHEATYEKMCLVNDAVYVAKYLAAEECEQRYGYIPKDNKKHPGQWTATGTQFQVPYVFKTLFSHEPIKFEDVCETKSVSSALYLDMNEDLPDVSELEKELSGFESKYKKGELSDTLFEQESEKLVPSIQKGHNYVFVGRVGQFCPVKPGCGGGLLKREKDGKYYAATGSSGYRWMESEMVRSLGKEDSVDESYYISLVDAAVETISKYGDVNAFVA